MSNEKSGNKSILQKELNAKELLVVLGITGAIAAYGFAFIYPKYTDFKLAKDNLVSIESQISEYENRINNMPTLKKKLESLTSELNVKSRKLAHDMEDGMFLIGLSQVMDSYSVDLVSYYVGEAIPYETFYAIPTTIEVRGNYRNIREVMYYMESQKNMTQILDYSMDNYIEEPEITIDPNINMDNNSAVENVQPQVEEKPRATGDVVATFKFVMYSANNPTLDLNNDDASKWEPGKWNPFKTTTR